MRKVLIIALTLLLLIALQGQTAAEPSWTRPVFPSQQDQQMIDSTPILERPYRPFHFYGNAVRRKHYRGSYMPRPRDFVQSTAALMGRYGDIQTYFANSNVNSNTSQPASAPQGPSIAQEAFQPGPTAAKKITTQETSTVKIKTLAN